MAPKEESDGKAGAGGAPGSSAAMNIRNARVGGRDGVRVLGKWLGSHGGAAGGESEA